MVEYCDLSRSAGTVLYADRSRDLAKVLDGSLMVGFDPDAAIHAAIDLTEVFDLVIALNKHGGSAQDLPDGTDGSAQAVEDVGIAEIGGIHKCDGIGI